MGDYSKDYGTVFWAMVYTFPTAIMQCYVPIGRIYECGNQGVKVEMLSLTINSNSPLGEFIFPVPTVLGS